MKYNIGDKVVPINKTVDKWEVLSNSAEWERAKIDKQDFLFVNMIDKQDCYGQIIPYVCGKHEHTSGDFFNESDLIPYVEK